MVLSDTTNGDGLIQEIERITQLGLGGISGSVALLKAFTARINQALDRFFSIALMNDGTWQFDDTNYTTLPIGVTDLVSGQQDYAFAADVLAIERLFIKDPQGNWQELRPVDISNLDTDAGARNIWELPSGDAGTPMEYDKHANSIFLTSIPNYNSTGGLKAVFKRNAVKYTYGVTANTVQPGIPSLFHPYLARVAALPWLVETGKTDASSVNTLILQDEDRIAEWFSKRSRDDNQVIRTKHRSSR